MKPDKAPLLHWGLLTHCDAVRAHVAGSATHNIGGGCKVCETCHPLDTLEMNKEERHSGGKVCERNRTCIRQVGRE